MILLFNGHAVVAVDGLRPRDRRDADAAGQPLPALVPARLASCWPASLVSILQVYAFLAIAWFWGVQPPPLGYLTVLPALVLSGMMLGALGLFLSSAIRQLENFAGVMNFVIFPMFFASSALYPLWRMREFERAAARHLPPPTRSPTRSS